MNEKNKKIYIFLAIVLAIVTILLIMLRFPDNYLGYSISYLILYVFLIVRTYQESYSAKWLMNVLMAIFGVWQFSTIVLPPRKVVIIGDDSGLGAKNIIVRFTEFINITPNTMTLILLGIFIGLIIGINILKLSDY